LLIVERRFVAGLSFHLRRRMAHLRIAPMHQR
jgi:hypothetical protein